MEWQPIETAPKDGRGIIITDGEWVHYGWWRDDVADYPWAMIDSHDMTPTGCCDMEDADRVSPNGWREQSPTHWMPLPEPPHA